MTSFMDSLYTKEDIEVKLSVPYTVRNTFIEPAPQGDESLFESIFSTWPLRVSPEVHSPEAQRAAVDITGGYGGEAGAGLFGAEALFGASMVAALNPATEQAPQLPLLEDGEILEDEDEDGEILEEGEAQEEEGEEQGEMQEEEEEDEEEKMFQQGQGELEEGEVLEELGLPDRPVKGALWPVVSLGSLLHSQGRCRPCAWLHKSAEGCRHGQQCEFCHLCGPGELKRRKREKAQLSLAEQVRRQQALLASDLLSPSAAGTGSGAAGALLAGAGDTTGAGAAAGDRLGAVLSMEPCYVDVATPSPVRRQSRGSAGHAISQCRPCAWVHKEVGGCKNGSRCKYCHLCPPGELKRRKRQKRWMQAMMEGATNVANVPIQVEGTDMPFPQRCYPGA
mmetsp:Transcript_22128/g.66507  ORF Transcript_22128/g.66507 Transcript_22128/m.66507 type:complete len:393 (-) Transcript_22128:172-1350(-)